MPDAKQSKPLNIAVDFDGTFTANTSMFCQLVGMMKKYGADVRIVTFRFENANNADIEKWSEALNIPAIYTDGKQKDAVCAALGFKVDIWIDDSPVFIPAKSDLVNVAHGCEVNGE